MRATMTLSPFASSGSFGLPGRSLRRSTPSLETIGTAASLGCLRAPAEEARRLVRSVPLGTLVTIRA